MAASSSGTGLNYQDIIDFIQELLEVGIHYILYVRGVYPADLFDQYKKWSFRVWKSRHPTLSSYIAQVVKASIQRIKEGNVKKVVVAIKDIATNQALEHFIFGLTWLKPAEWFQDPDLVRQYDSRLTYAEMEMMMRSYLLKLSVLDAQLSPLPKDLTFTVFLEMSDVGFSPIQGDPETGNPSPWLPASMAEGDAVEHPNDNLQVLRKCTLGMLDLELEVEESLNKDLNHGKPYSNPSSNSGTSNPNQPTPVEDSDVAITPEVKVDKGKGRALE